MITSAMTRVDFQRHAYFMLIIGAFFLAYLISLKFVYVEGDDAASMAYHTLGRDADFQEPYSPYQRMADQVLNILPSEENVMRTGAMLMTAIAAVIMLVLIFALVFDWLGDSVTPTQRWIITAVALLASPEYFYFGLVYSPSWIAMSFALSAHLLLRNLMRGRDVPDLSQNRDRLIILLSIVLFGFGMSFRWDVIPYGAVIFFDVLLMGTRLRRDAVPVIKKRLLYWVGWGVLALAAAVIAITLSGSASFLIPGRTKTVGLVLDEAGSTSLYRGLIDAETLATLATLVTPGLALIGILGFFRMLKKRDARLIVVVIGILGGGFWLPTGVPKYIIMGIPGIILCFSYGFLALWYEQPPSLKWIMRGGIVLLLLIPWFVGVQVTRAESAWGGSFRLMDYDRPFDVDTSFGVGLKAGTAFPTTEGPRPLMGHFYVLFGGRWSELITLRDDERKQSLDRAIAEDIPLLATQWSSAYFFNDLVDRGYATDDPQDRLSPANDYFVERRFTDNSGREVILLEHEITGGGAPEDLAAIASLNAATDKIVIDGYPSTMRYLYEIAPDALEKIGATSAVLDIAALCAAEIDGVSVCESQAEG